MDSIESALHDIDSRLRLVEADLTRMAGTRKVLFGMATFLLVQAVAGAVGYGQLINTVQSLDSTELRTNVSTSLRVLADHGTEFETIRREQAQIRLILEGLHQEDSDIRDLVAESTRERFFRDDIYPVYNRIEALERRVERNEGYIFGPSGQPQ